MMESLSSRGGLPAAWRWIASTADRRRAGEPCLVMCPRGTLTSDSRCRGVSPAQPQLAGAGEPAGVADLGDDDGGQHRADPRQPQHRLVRRVAAEEVGGHLIEHGGLRGAWPAPRAPGPWLMTASAPA
jgi:hypothetical protein